MSNPTPRNVMRTTPKGRIADHLRAHGPCSSSELRRELGIGQHHVVRCLHQLAADGAVRLLRAPRGSASILIAEPIGVGR